MAKIPPMTLVRTHPEVERKIHAALVEQNAKRPPPPKDAVYLSSIGKCPRELWAAIHDIPDERPPPGPALMTFDVGRDLESTVVGWLKAAGYEVKPIDEHGDQFRVYMESGVARGKIDGLIRWGRPSLSDWRLLEVKTAKAKRFDELIASGGYRAWNPEYYDQLQGYMGASHETEGIPDLTDCLVVVVCKDDARLWPEMVAFDPERYATLKRKAQMVVESQEIIPRPKPATSQYCKYCKWCSRNKWCWSPVAGVEFDE